MTITSVASKPFNVLCLAVGLAVFAVAGCDPQGGGIASSPDASAGSGGTGSGGAANGGTSGSGGKVGTGGSGSGGSAGSGGASVSGGTPGTGGSSGGKPGTGGAASGGAVGSGGAAGGGGTSVSGGASGTGGKVGSGGTPGNDAGIGGVKGSGGVAGGTSGTGGTTGSGGATSTSPCTPDWGTTPTNVSQWIDASWASQLGDNVKNRKDWLIDNAVLGKGQINLCVRWGASTAPSAAVKSGMGAAVEKWFNDWFKQLDGYGCFPYPKITAKVTGWAVRPGKESWVSDLDSSIKVYTETDPGTDPPNEPKCPDACSFFSNWTHKFPNCPGGEAFHTDYWLWLDDKLPGGGAAAVGGDWGLRMPVSNFVASMGSSNLVIEHEMGHGFGFQDYYEWGSNPTPAGGSLMIVGSTSSQTPTVGDTWLLRRTWKEMKTLRGW